VTDAHFERLSAMDMSLLAMEDGRAHMHMGSAKSAPGATESTDSSTPPVSRGWKCVHTYSGLSRVKTDRMPRPVIRSLSACASAH